MRARSTSSASVKGAPSRIYKTTDGGASWTLQFQNDDPDAFFDCMDFWDEETGFAFSDAAGGQFVIITTADGGRTWTRVPPEDLPPAFAGEGSFAASGTCAAAHGERRGWIGTGNAVGQPARVLRTTDRGETWQAAPAPIDGGDGAGLTSVLFRDAQHGLAVGPGGASYSADDGRSWTPLGTTRAYWGVAFAAPQVMERATRGWIAGPGGRLTRVRIRY